MYKINEIIENGRRYAYGIGTIIDIEKAYQYWKDIRNYFISHK